MRNPHLAIVSGLNRSCSLISKGGGFTPELEALIEQFRAQGSRRVPHLALLYKPAGAACQLNCAYCFYRELAHLRGDTACAPHTASVQSAATRQALLLQGLLAARQTVVFQAQGGEPSLAGLAWFEAAVQEVALFQALLDQRGIRPPKVSWTFQTHGLTLNADWIRFFRQTHTLVGLSYDGDPAIHDRYRGAQTAQRVEQTLKALQAGGVDTNVLCVVTRDLGQAAGAQALWTQVQQLGLTHLQLIPCLPPLQADKTRPDLSPDPVDYADFLTLLFEHYAAAATGSHPVSIRLFDNWVRLLNGYPAEACDQQGCCRPQPVIEQDGSVYPCDFDCLPVHRLGNIQIDLLLSQLTQPYVKTWASGSGCLPSKCQRCPWWPLCRNGCRRRRRIFEPGDLPRDHLCETYCLLFPRIAKSLNHLARQLRLNL